MGAGTRVVLKVTGAIRGLLRRKACVALAGEQASLVAATPWPNRSGFAFKPFRRDRGAFDRHELRRTRRLLDKQVRKWGLLALQSTGDRQAD